MPQKFIFMMDWDQEVIRSEEIGQKGHRELRSGQSWACALGSVLAALGPRSF